MGLDMSIIKKTYIPGKKMSLDLEASWANKEPITLEFNNVTGISEEIAYWRKAWPLHKWFVSNVQGGVDDCREYHLSSKDLQSLLAMVSEILSSEEREVAAWRLLPPYGFIDDYYFEHLETAKSAAESILEKMNEPSHLHSYYYYSSSW